MGPVLVAMLALVVAGCGGGGGEGGLDSTLRYFPPDPSSVVVISTDLESDQFRNLDRIVERRAHRTIESLLRNGASQVGLSWEKDLEPLLGRELTVGLTAPPVGGVFSGGVVAAFHASSGGKLREVLDKAHVFRRAGELDGARLYRVADGGPPLAVDGDVLVVAQSEGQLRSALDRAHGGDHFEEARFDRALRGLPAGALVRAYGDVSALGALPRFGRFRDIPWFDAIRTAGAALSFERGRAIVDVAANTDPSRLNERDLPLATGDDPPEVFSRPGEIVSGNRNQSLTTVFLFRVAEVAFPNSRFVEDVHALQRQLGIDFAREVLRQFDGPSASAVSLDGKTFAARSDVSDPEALRRVLPRIAPHLPGIVKALQGLQSEGEALLFLFAPDVLVGQGDDVTVTAPTGPNGFWRVTGLSGPGPDELFFGVAGKSFVVASSEALARQVVDEPTRKVPGAHGAAVLHVDLGRVSREQLQQANLAVLKPLGRLVAWVQAGRSQLRAQVRLELP